MTPTLITKIKKAKDKMKEERSKGRQNKLTGQIGEHLVCAELGRRGLIATPFAGNVPTFDVIVADSECRTIPIQVKTTTGVKWVSQATEWMDIAFDKKSSRQTIIGPRLISNPELIYVLVSLKNIKDPESKDRFFILTKADIQDACIEKYTEYLSKHNWVRPKSPKSFDCRYEIDRLESFEDNWKVITNRLSPNDTM